MAILNLTEYFKIIIQNTPLTSENTTQKLNKKFASHIADKGVSEYIKYAYNSKNSKIKRQNLK